MTTTWSAMCHLVSLPYVCPNVRALTRTNVGRVDVRVCLLIGRHSCWCILTHLNTAFPSCAHQWAFVNLSAHARRDRRIHCANIAVIGLHLHTAEVIGQRVGVESSQACYQLENALRNTITPSLLHFTLVGRKNLCFGKGENSACWL